MTRDQLVAAIRRITYKSGWTLALAAGPASFHHVLLQVRFVGPCAVTGAGGAAGSLPNSAGLMATRYPKTPAKIASAIAQAAMAPRMALSQPCGTATISAAYRRAPQRDNSDLS